MPNRFIIDENLFNIEYREHGALWSTSVPKPKPIIEWDSAANEPNPFYANPNDNKIYSTKSKRFKIENGFVYYNNIKVTEFTHQFYEALSRSNQYQSAVRLAKRWLKVLREDRSRVMMSSWTPVMWDINNRTEGHYIRVCLNRRMEAIHVNKEPKSTKRHIGVEIEFLAPKYDDEEVKKAFIDAGLHNTVTYHSDSSVQGGCEGDCVTECEDNCSTCDGSCRRAVCDCILEADQFCETNHCPADHGCDCDLGCHCDETEGHEICVIAEATEIEAVITKVCAVLNDKLDARVNKTCGLHVHLDARRKNTVKMYEKLSSQVEFIASLVPQSRRRSTYCQVNPKNRSLTEMLDNGDRYWMINPQSLRKHNTIEIRAHSGTTDPIKIIKWVKLMSWLAYTRKATDKIESFEQLIKEGFDLKDTLYFVDRFDKFKDTRPSRQLWTPLTGIDTLKQMTLNENASEAS